MRKSLMIISLFLSLCVLNTSCDNHSAGLNREKAKLQANVNTNQQPTKTSGDSTMQLNSLTEEEKRVILHKGTEMPGTGKYTDFTGKGTYLCKQCDTPLYRSESKFHSGCGWPSFDDEIQGAVTRVPDADGRRTEIICSHCKGHLGHVFLGEGFTNKDTRHCVNSISLKFKPEDSKATMTSETAVYCGGCFWGVEHFFQNVKGVLSTQVGYIGGAKENPTYEEVCSGKTGHIEALQVVFDPSQVSYEKLTKLFFEIHDPTQANGQGNDIGEQYHSVIFYQSEEQKNIATDLIKQLTQNGYKVATKLRTATTFYKAEDYHQKYYQKTGGSPYCHRYQKRFAE